MIFFCLAHTRCENARETIEHVISPAAINLSVLCPVTLLIKDTAQIVRLTQDTVSAKWRLRSNCETSC